RAARRARRLRRPAPRPGHRRLLRLGGRRPRGGRRRLNAAPPDSAYLPRTDEGRAGHDLLVAGPPFALPAVVLRPPPGCGAGGSLARQRRHGVGVLLEPLLDRLGLLALVELVDHHVLERAELLVGHLRLGDPLRGLRELLG